MAAFVVLKYSFLMLVALNFASCGSRRNLYRVTSSSSSSSIRSQYSPKATSTTTTEAPKPFRYSYAAGRAPGGKPDRYVQQEGDEEGVIKGSYAYLDPNWKWQKVEYVADPDGFHVVDESAGLPEDTQAVKDAKERHKALFNKIAERNRAVAAGSYVPEVNEETDAVKQKRQEHAEAFRKIAEEHARIAAEQSRLSSLAAHFGAIYD